MIDYVFVEMVDSHGHTEHVRVDQVESVKDIVIGGSYKHTKYFMKSGRTIESSLKWEGFRQQVEEAIYAVQQ